MTYYTNAAGDQVTFALSGTTLQRTMDRSTNALVTNLTSLGFVYYRMGTYNGTWVVASNDPVSTAELPVVMITASGQQDGLARG